MSNEVMSNGVMERKFREGLTATAHYLIAHYPITSSIYTVNSFLLFFRLLCKVLPPPGVRMRFKKPWRRLRCFFLGWYVLLGIIVWSLD